MLCRGFNSLLWILNLQNKFVLFYLGAPPPKKKKKFPVSGLRVSAFEFFFAMKRCPIAANIAGLEFCRGVF